MGTLKTRSQIQSQMLEALDFMPMHRQKFKRTAKLNLDVLLDDARSLQTIEASTLDFVLMGYRWSALFRRELSKFLKKPLTPPEIADLFQIIFAALLTRTQIPEGVIVHEAVELANTRFGPFTKGMSNAFFRQVLRDKAKLLDEVQNRPEILLGDIFFRRLDRSPETRRRLAMQLAERPESGIAAFNERGEWGQKGIGDFLNTADPLQAMDAGSWAFCQWAVSEFLKTHSNDTPLHFLDACAAPGGKLLAFYFLLKQKKVSFARIVASEPKHVRLETLSKNIKRFGLESKINVELKAWGQPTTEPKSENPDEAPKPFDLILADLPCTGSGTLHSRPDLLDEDIGARLVELKSLQASILKDLLQQLKGGASLFVSICSVDIEEIEWVQNCLGLEAKHFESFQTLTTRCEGITAWHVKK